MTCPEPRYWKGWEVQQHTSCGHLEKTQHAQPPPLPMIVSFLCYARLSTQIHHYMFVCACPKMSESLARNICHSILSYLSFFYFFWFRSWLSTTWINHMNVRYRSTRENLHGLPTPPNWSYQQQFSVPEARSQTTQEHSFHSVVRLCAPNPGLPSSCW